MPNEQVFQQVNYTLNGLVSQIGMGAIGLPDIQRPFVWKNTKVRDLFDSMYRGYPVGYLLFWQNMGPEKVHSIDASTGPLAPNLLIVDGQQRLTSLYAVIKNIAVLRDNYTKEFIKIAFNPLEEKFEVTDAAIERNKLYITDVSVIWSERANLFEIVSTYLENVGTIREITSEDRQKIQNAFIKLQGLLSYPFTALVLASSVDEEVVGDVFVRINSKGTPLNQADFILTLMSVFADEQRTNLENFCIQARQPAVGNQSPFNLVFQPDPDQLLRVSVGLGFQRSRLRIIYSLLRGKDLDTETFSDASREAQFEILRNAQKQVLNLQNWHNFLECVRKAGFLESKMITSQSNLLFSYILYLVGKIDYQVEPQKLVACIAKWLFMSSLTARFASSPESSMEADLARLRGVNNADDFLAVLNVICEQTLTDDFWNITLPNDLATSSSRSPSLSAFHAALVLSDATALFGDKKVAELLNPNNASIANRHHLFSRKYLQRQGITELREINQIANYSLIDWSDKELRNQLAQSPDENLDAIKSKISDIDLEIMYLKHALPDDWEQMAYKDFLEVRRKKMSAIIKMALGHSDFVARG